MRCCPARGPPEVQQVWFLDLFFFRSPSPESIAANPTLVFAALANVLRFSFFVLIFFFFVRWFMGSPSNPPWDVEEAFSVEAVAAWGPLKEDPDALNDLRPSFLPSFTNVTFFSTSP